MEAKKYQFKAIKALLPEQASEHLAVCERELTAMLKECVLEGLIRWNGSKTTHENRTSQYKENGFEKREHKSAEDGNSEKTGRTRKVTIQ